MATNKLVKQTKIKSHGIDYNDTCDIQANVTARLYIYWFISLISECASSICDENKSSSAFPSFTDIRAGKMIASSRRMVFQALS